jgi:hypothetical protein
MHLITQSKIQQSFFLRQTRREESKSSNAITEAHGNEGLTANIFRPAGSNDTEKLPVAVYLHGGAFNRGSAQSKIQQSFFLRQTRREESKSSNAITEAHGNEGALCLSPWRCFQSGFGSYAQYCVHGGMVTTPLRFRELCSPLSSLHSAQAWVLQRGVLFQEPRGHTWTHQWSPMAVLSIGVRQLCTILRPWWHGHNAPSFP